MGLLERKLLRDVWRTRWQVAAVTLMVFLGVAMFIGLYGGYLNLDNSFRYSYQELKMADYWLSVDSISLEAVDKIRSLPGVTVEGRLVRDLQISIPEHGRDNLSIRIISLPGDRRADVTDVQVVKGSYFSGNNAREILLISVFADRHGFEPGDQVTLKIDSREIRFRVAGIVDSPEYLMLSKSSQEPVPSPHNFGVGFLPADTAEKLLNMRGMANEIVLAMDGEVETKSSLAQVESILKDYGVGRMELIAEPASFSTRKEETIQGFRTARVITLEDLPGHKMLNVTLEMFNELAFIFPLFFLGLGAVTTYVLLARIIAAQRPQIGLLKAIGYSGSKVLKHYLAYGALMGITGSILGAAAGWFLQGILARQFAVQLSIPFVELQSNLPLLGVGIFTGAIISIVASFISARQTIDMHPADSMRPATPGGSRRPLLERLIPIPAWLPMPVKLALRSILRNPNRSLFMMAGMMAAVSLILTTAILLDSMETTLDVYYNKILGYDAKVIANGLIPENRALETSYWQGVEKAEPLLEVPYRFRYQSEFQNGLLVGLPAGHSLYNLIDPQSQSVKVQADGLALSMVLKEQLGVELGDMVQIEPIPGVIGRTEVKVSSFVDISHGGAVAFMPLKKLQRTLKTPGIANGLLLDFAGNPSLRLRHKLDGLPGIESVAFNAADKEYCMGEHLAFAYAFIYVLMAFGLALGATIVFSTVTVSVQERVREFSTLRTIGMSFWHLSSLITLENLILGSIGIGLGLLAGKWLGVYFVSIMATEQFYMLPVISFQSYVLTVIILLAVLLISQIPSLLYVGRMNLVSATKDWTA